MENQAIYMVMILVGALLTLNAVATYIVFHTCFEIRERRLYQVLFIWFVPIVGAIIAIYTNREDCFEQRYKEKIGNKTTISNNESTTQSVATDHEHID